MSIKVVSYKIGSGGARSLSDGLKALGHTVHRVNRDSPTYRLRRSHMMINWGCSSLDIDYHLINILNTPQAVALASNKLHAFQRLQQEGVTIPEFTDDWREAVRWAYDGDVLIRRKLTGHSGEGISFINRERDALDNTEYCRGMYAADTLFVKYIKKQDEYRVHVFDGNVIDIQQKRKRQETPNEEVDYKVRNHQNGWVYCRDGITEPEGIRELAVAACNSLALDFGAVDIIYNAHQNRCYVLEVNCAPGLAGSTVDRYTNAINTYIEKN